MKEHLGNVVVTGSSSGIGAAAVTDSLRVELRRWNIDVSIIEAGNVTTPIWRKSMAAAREMDASLSELERELYGDALQRVYGAVEDLEKSAAPVEAVAEAVLHAFTSKRPKSRYIVGKGVKRRIWLSKFLPDRLRDQLVRKRLGLSVDR
jgi:short-subunit dehydrogenase